MSQIVGPNRDEALIHRLVEQFRATRAGLAEPRDFDPVAEQARLNRLAERLSQAYGCPLAASKGPAQEGALFGGVRIPAEATRTRTKRTRVPLSLTVEVSNFGGLATYRPVYDWSTPWSPESPTPTHPDDRERIEEALTRLGYRVVPTHVLDTPYDGPNSDPNFRTTWYIRFFDIL